MRSRRPLMFALATVAGLAVLAGGWFALGHDQGGGQRYVTEHATPLPEKARTVTISATMPAPSAHARRLSAMLQAGAMPRGPMMAEVLTDTECVPDARMVSRCRNEMELAHGGRIVVRHPHDMRNVPCLAPGEKIRLLPNAA